MAESAGAIKAGRAFVEIFADDLGLKAGLNRASARMRGWATTVSKIGLGVIAMGAAIVTPLVFAGVEAAEYGHQLENAATKTGLAVSEIAGLGYAAKMSGSSIESLEIGIKKMQVTIAGASHGSKQAAAALDLIGLSVSDLLGLSPNDQFKLIADRIMALPDPMLRTAAAVKIFGRAGADLLPILTKGSAGIAAMQKKAEELGITLAADMAESVGDVGGIINTLTAQIFALKTVIGVAIATALRPLITASQPIIAGWIRWVAANQDLVKTILYVGTGLVVIGGVLVAVGVGATLLLALYGNLIGLAVTVGSVIAGAFSMMVSPIGLVVMAVGAVIAAFAYLSGFGGEALGYLGELWGNLKTTAMDAWGGIVAAVGAGDIALAGQIAFAGLKLAFAEVVGFLKQLWSSFKTHLLQLGFDGVYAVEAAWEEGVNGIAQAWTTAIKVMGDIWEGFKSLIRSGWNSTMNWFEDRWLDVIAKTTGADRAALQKQADGDRAHREREGNQNDMAESAKREADYKAQIAELQRQHQGKMAGVGKDANAADKILKDGNDAQQSKIAADLEAKKKELADLIAKAKAERAAAQKNPAGPNASKPNAPNFDAINRAGTSVGTFSGFGNFGQLGMSSFSKLEDYASRTADATEKIAEQGGDDDGTVETE